MSLSLGSILASALVSAAVYFVAIFVQRRRFYKDLPKPPHDPLWGHLKLFGTTLGLLAPKSHIQVAFTTLSQKYKLPGLFYLDLWPLALPQIIITDPDLALDITVANNLPKHTYEKVFAGRVVGNGSILLENGAAWKRPHRMLAPAFNATNVRSRTSMVAEEVLIFRSILQKYADSGETFSLEQVISNLTFDLIFTTTFGFSQEAQRKASPILQAFKALCDANYIIQGSFHPIRGYLARRKCTAVTKELDALIEPLVRERFELVRENNIDVNKRIGLSIIDLVIREYLALEKDNVGEGKGEAVRSEEAFFESAVSQIKTLLLGGTGTTTDTLCFAYMLLSKEPTIVSRLIDEHSHVFAPSLEEIVSLLQSAPHKLADLELTTNVLKETLRFYPIGHTLREADTIQYKGRVYPAKGHMVFPVSHTMHFDPAVFPNPSRFDPDRFSPAREGEHPRHAWRPFERGPRACLGQIMAMEEMKVVLLMTLREFEVECVGLRPNETPRVPWMDLDTKFGDLAFQEFVFEAKPRGGMMVRVKRRER